MRLPGTLLLAITLALAPAAAAQQARAVRVHSAPPTVDGRLDEPVWLEAPPVTEFLQKNPTEGAPASERTEVRFLYTDRDLFVGIRAFDREPDRIYGPL